MKISVLIPAYNAASTIKATLDTVFSQTEPPDEILIFDDGSKDNTAVILESYQPRITLFRDSNHGAAYARNFLCEHARGDILAFLDADDLWHPGYLAAQRQMIEKFPAAIAWFTEHENFTGLGDFPWPAGAASQSIDPELIPPAVFIKRLDKTPMSFQMSCCCIAKKVLSQLGQEPFQVSGAEDTYFLLMLALSGPVVRIPARFAAYRITERSLSSNQLKVSLLVLDALDLLAGLYGKTADAELSREFRAVQASRKRNCGKFLMGSGSVSGARAKFKGSLEDAGDPLSMGKSIALLLLSFMPPALQPKWPAASREVS